MRRQSSQQHDADVQRYVAVTRHAVGVRLAHSIFAQASRPRVQRGSADERDVAHDGQAAVRAATPDEIMCRSLRNMVQEQESEQAAHVDELIWPGRALNDLYTGQEVHTCR